MVKRSFMRVKKILEFLLLLLLIMAVMLLLIPRIFQISQHVVLSGSMEPAIPTGSLCYLSHRVPVDEIREGQVIGFHRIDGSLVMHRVIRIQDGHIYTKGDANDQEDHFPIQKADYFGTVVYAIPYLGYLTVFLQKKRVLIIIGMLAAIILMLEILVKKGERDEKV